MEKQRLRNLTTGKLHTDISFIYQDLEYITGMQGLMTHMLPNVMRAVMPWLKTKVNDSEYWDDKYSPELTGEYDIRPMNDEEKKEMFSMYQSMPHPFEQLGSKHKSNH